jgi:hypothetical protein
MTKMTPENKKIWTDALRSGDYKQGQDHLKKDDCYCCLGVAGVVLNPDGNIDTVRSSPSEELLSDTFGGPLGIDWKAQDDLSRMNDGRPVGGADPRYYSFAEIADWIEANL